MIILLPRELDELCNYITSKGLNIDCIRLTALMGQSYTRKFKDKIKHSLGGMVVVSSLFLIDGH